MTNFDYYARNPDELTRLLSAATDEALRAKGCSMRLTFPPDGDWYEWLMSDQTDLPLAPFFPEPLQSETAEQYNKRIVTDKLNEIMELVSRVNTSFAQAVIDILGEATESVEKLGGGDP